MSKYNASVFFATNTIIPFVFFILNTIASQNYYFLFIYANILRKIFHKKLFFMNMQILEIELVKKDQK